MCALRLAPDRGAFGKIMNRRMDFVYDRLSQCTRTCYVRTPFPDAGWRTARPTNRSQAIGNAHGAAADRPDRSTRRGSIPGSSSPCPG